MYESYYKLRGSPFVAVPEPGVFFRDAAREEVLQWLERGLPGGASVALVSGPQGVGKSALAAQFLTEADDAPVVARMLETPSAANPLIRAVAPLFGLMPRGQPAQLWEEFEAFLAARAQRGARLILFIDDAQELPPEAWDELARVAAMRRGTRVPLTCVLFGADETRACARALSGSGLVERRLEALDVEGVRSYVQYRLRSAGWAGDPQLEPELFAEIAARSGGLPRRINSLCDRLLTWGSLEGRHRLEAEDIVRLYDVQHGAQRVAAGGGGGSVFAGRAQASVPGGRDAAPSPLRGTGRGAAAPDPQTSAAAPAMPAAAPVRKSVAEDLAEIDRLAAQLEATREAEAAAQAAAPRHAEAAVADIEALRPRRDSRAELEMHRGPRPTMPAWPGDAWNEDFEIEADARPVRTIEHRRTGGGWMAAGAFTVLLLLAGAAVYGGWIPLG